MRRSKVQASLVPQFTGSSRPSLSLLSAVTTLLAFALVTPARSQDLTPPAKSVVEAARNARERQANSAKHPKIITNADLGVPHSAPTATAFDLHSSSIYADEGSNPLDEGCDNPRAARVMMELQFAQRELDQLRSELSYEPPVISNGDLDLQYFKPGYSGLYVGSPPLLETEPPIPERVAVAELEERVESLKKALRIACEPPEAARLQSDLDEAEAELNLLQRQFALDEDAYYSNPNYAEDTEGNARLEAELQDIEYLQSEIDRLRQNLVVLNTP